MKIHLAFLCPYNNTGIGGGDRKYGIYFRNLDSELFDGYMIFVTSDTTKIQKTGKEVILTEELILPFLKEKKIEYVYYGGAKISKEIEDAILSHTFWLVNINFTPLYTTHPRKYNLIISMTDYWKLRWIHKQLSNSYVVYNPIDVELWKEKRIHALGKYRTHFAGKQYIVGRIARAEPSKWHYLILATLKQLDKEKNYQYGFLFAGMPWLYRQYIKHCLSKEMQACIEIIPEQRSHEDIAEFYASIDLFWQASWIGESFGNVIAEAACFEVPTLTDVKDFYRHQKVDPSLYDAQIELVDDGITGAYRSTPKSSINWFTHLSTDVLSNLGKNAYSKVLSTYHIHDTTRTLARILYDIGREQGLYEKEMVFENIEKNPSDIILENYQYEYGKRVALSRQFDTISQGEIAGYRRHSQIFRLFEYFYLFMRKLLKNLFSQDIEKI